MKVDFDVIVLGAGFAGAATAYHLSRLGSFRMLILEKETKPGSHASGKNAALLRQAVGDAGVAEMVQETLSALKNPPDDWRVKNIFRRSGSLLLGESSALSAFASILKNLEVENELRQRGSLPQVLDPQLREALATADYEASLFTPGDGVVDVAGLLQNYLDAAVDRGAMLRCGSAVQNLTRENGIWRVTSKEGVFFARALVNAAGAWAGGLGELAGFSGRGLHSFRRHLFVADGLAPLEHPYVWDTRHDFYFRPDSRGLLLCAGDETPHPPEAPQVDPEVQILLSEKLTRHFPALSGSNILQSWACLRTFCPQLPYLIQEEPEETGFIWVAGLGGHGMGSSFGAGRRAAERAIAFLNRQKG